MVRDIKNDSAFILSEVEVVIDQNVILKGNLCIPLGCHSIVIFAHGSGSSRFSIRNKFVAEWLQKEQIATLLIDLLTEKEDAVYANRFNIDLLTGRLVAVTNYILDLPSTASFTIGYFGASTGAASALRAATRLQEVISAVVSRGGRPDLAAGTLGKVKAPTLLIVGSLDQDVIELNRKALAVLPNEKKLVIVEGASHLFEEAGKLKEVAELATRWFIQYLN